MRFEGKLPVNSRIILDYKKKKCYFNYPGIKKITKWTVFHQNFLGFLTIWLRILLFPFLIGFLYYSITTPLRQTEAVTLTRYSNPLVSVGVSILDQFFLLILITTLGVPLILSLLSLRYPKIGLLIPYFQKNWWLIRNRGYYQARFNGNSEKEIKIPLFKNIFLDYKTTQDYSRYLSKVMIKEIPLMIIRGKKKQKQDDYWFATFIFSKKPRKGFLIVDYI